LAAQAKFKNSTAKAETEFWYKKSGSRSDFSETLFLASDPVNKLKILASLQSLR